MAAALARAALLPRNDHPLALGAALALLAHAGLIGALALGLNWRLPRQEAVLTAELWAAVPQAAAPGPVARPAAPTAAAPAPTPTPKPAPAPTPAPAPKPDPVRRVEPPPPSAAERDAEIALEKAAQRKKAQQEALARESHAAAERERQAVADALRLKQKQDDKRLADDKAQARQRDLAAKDAKARDEQRQRDLAQQRDKQQKEAATQVQDAVLAKQREENLKRMLGQAGGAGAAGATGAANATAGPATSAGYAGRVSARIKSNLIKAAEVVGNPITEVEVKCAPDGSIVGRRITQPSGNAVWDDIVLRAIDRTATLPRDTDGRIPPTMLLTFSRQE